MVNKLRSLEMIRAFAALLVVLFHIQDAFGIQIRFGTLRNFIAGGDRGVDLFFVLSGFIIAYVHRNDLDRPERLGNYLFNRVARIYPAVWIMSALALAVYLKSPITPEKLEKLAPTAVILSVLLLPQQNVPLVNVTWTLTYEIFFYIIFAISIINFRVGVALFLAWQAATALFALSSAGVGLFTYYLRPICLDFSIGLACALFIINTRSTLMQRGVCVVALAAGFVIFLAGMWLHADVTLAAILCPVGAGLIIVSLVRLEQAEYLRIPDLLVALGGASYAIYLVHFSVIQLLYSLLRRLGVPSADLIFLVCLSAGVAAGVAFDYWVDKPIQRQLRRLKTIIFRNVPRDFSENAKASSSP